jgi:hypothetical protein
LELPLSPESKQALEDLVEFPLPGEITPWHLFLAMYTYLNPQVKAMLEEEGITLDEARKFC